MAQAGRGGMGLGMGMGSASQRMIGWALGTYAVGVNAGSAYLFYHDKQAALRHEWRVRESTLVTSALLGGWIGGCWAMQQFRHKTQKRSFQVPYFSAMGANIAVVGLLAATKTGRQTVASVFSRAGRTNRWPSSSTQGQSQSKRFNNNRNNNSDGNSNNIRNSNNRNNGNYNNKRDRY